MANNQRTKIIIVGAGIAGMCTAVALATSSKSYEIIVIEQGSAVSELGAGVQISPNWTRLLYSWGLKDELERYGVQPAYNNFIRWEDGRVLSKVKTNAEDNFVQKYGYPFYHIHRADLIRVLVERAQQLGITIQTDTTVTSFEPGTDSKSSTVYLANGDEVTADVVVGADGGRSTISSFVTGHANPGTNVGDSAYRALFPISLLEEPELAIFKEGGSGVTNIWVGPDSHVVTYLVRNMEMLNLVVLVPDSIEPGAEENWKQKGDVGKLREFFKNWDPHLQKVLGLVDESYLWRLRDRPALDKWVHDSANLVLLGDAAHPMLPYAASGAACCGEDAATLAACLERVTTDGKFGVRDALKAFEALRIKRATEMVNQSRSNRKIFHMHDGPEQQGRDAGIADPDRMAKMMAGVHGFHAIKEVNEYFEKQQ